MSLRFGLLGTGYWAAVTQAAALAVHPDARFVGVWGRDPVKAMALAKRYEVQVFDDVEALLNRVDAVAIALPPTVQAELALRAARAGKHLLLDKPLALDLDAANALVDEVDRQGLASLVFVTKRFHPAVDGFLREAVEVGGWDSGRATLRGSIYQPGSPYAGSVWRRSYGGLWDLGPHALALLLPVLGPVIRVHTFSGPKDTSHVLLQHHDGAVSTMELTLDAALGSTANEIVFRGRAGTITVPPTGTAVEAFGEAIGQLTHAVRKGLTRHPCDVRFGREIVAILQAAEAARRLPGMHVPLEAYSEDRPNSR